MLESPKFSWESVGGIWLADRESYTQSETGLVIADVSRDGRGGYYKIELYIPEINWKSKMPYKPYLTKADAKKVVEEALKNYNE